MVKIFLWHLEDIMDVIAMRWIIINFVSSPVLWMLNFL